MFSCLSSNFIILSSIFFYLSQKNVNIFFSPHVNLLFRNAYSVNIGLKINCVWRFQARLLQFIPSQQRNLSRIIPVDNLIIYTYLDGRHNKGANSLSKGESSYASCSELSRTREKKIDCQDGDHIFSQVAYRNINLPVIPGQVLHLSSTK